MATSKRSALTTSAVNSMPPGTTVITTASVNRSLSRFAMTSTPSAMSSAFNTTSPKTGFFMAAPDRLLKEGWPGVPVPRLC